MVSATQYAISDSEDAENNKFFVNFYAHSVVIRDLDAEIQDGGNEIELKGLEVDNLIEILSLWKAV